MSLFIGNIVLGLSNLMAILPLYIVLTLGGPNMDAILIVTACLSSMAYHITERKFGLPGVTNFFPPSTTSPSPFERSNDVLSERSGKTVLAERSRLCALQIDWWLLQVDRFFAIALGIRLLLWVIKTPTLYRDGWFWVATVSSIAISIISELAHIWQKAFSASFAPPLPPSLIALRIVGITIHCLWHFSAFLMAFWVLRVAISEGK